MTGVRGLPAAKELDRRARRHLRHHLPVTGASRTRPHRRLRSSSGTEPRRPGLKGGGKHRRMCAFCIKHKKKKPLLYPPVQLAMSLPGVYNIPAGLLQQVKEEPPTTGHHPPRHFRRVGPHLTPHAPRVPQPAGRRGRQALARCPAPSETRLLKMPCVSRASLLSPQTTTKMRAINTFCGGVQVSRWSL